MRSYEGKLKEFAAGKRLLRLARPIRDRADACCDACSSTQPRILRALRDEVTGRHFFVGDTCLKGLVKAGAVLRRFGRESGPAVYEDEVQRRAQALDGANPNGDSGKDSARSDAEAGPLGVDARPALVPQISPLVPTVLLIEGPERSQAFVYLCTPRGTICAVGHATEPRFEEIWSGGGQRGMLLERVKRERRHTLDASINRAWRQAWSRLQESEWLPLLQNGGKKPGHTFALPDSIVAVLDSIATAYRDSDPVPHPAERESSGSAPIESVGSQSAGS